MMEDAEIKHEDRELFRNSIGEVVPIKHTTANLTRHRPAPVPARTLADERAVMQCLAEGDFDPADLEFNDRIEFKRQGLQEHVFQKLRRGQFSIQAELDLHGMTLDTARPALAGFLEQVKTGRQGCVRIIHGKGRGSRDGRPVLKLHLQNWLRRHNDVLAYASARPRDGGTGAVYVLVKSRQSGRSTGAVNE